MARTRKKPVLEERMNLIIKLRERGIVTEKQLNALSIESLLETENNITAEDLREILKLKQRVKSGKLFSWLCEDPELDEPTSSDFNENTY